MSLPIPSTSTSRQQPQTASGSSNLDPKQVQAMDAPLIALTQQCNGDLRQLMYAFFSFLHRRTDFYLVPHPDDDDDDDVNNVDSGGSGSGGKGTGTKMGFPEGDAEKLLLAAFRQFPLRRIPKGFGNPGNVEGGSTSQQGGKSSSSSATTTTNNAVSSASDVVSGTNTSSTAPTTNIGGGTKIDNSNDDKSNTKKVSTSAIANEDVAALNMKGISYTEEGLQIPVGNGGSTPKYKWTQTLEETTVVIGIPQTLRGKDFDVSISPSKISIKAKRPLPDGDHPITFVDGQFVEKIRADESTWTVEGGVMIVTLDKLQKKFWSNVLVGDEQIDTELVDSRRHISDYDEATQGQIRKIIFDQNQYHKGLPSSDEILGTGKSTAGAIPELPPGVEYIDKKKLDAVEDSKKK